MQALLTFIIVTVFPLVSSSSGNTTVLNGTESIGLYCDIEADPPAEIVWFFNGEQLVQDANKYRFIDSNTQLVVQALLFSDDGLYVCVGSNVFGSINATVKLNIQGEYCLVRIDVTTSTAGRCDRKIIG